MAEYIDREAAYEDFEKCNSENPKWTPCRVKALIACQKAADVSQVHHGRWLDVQETDMYVPDLKFTATKTAETCSVCRARIGFIGAKLYLFDSCCPSCGAKMDGGQDG